MLIVPTYHVFYVYKWTYACRSARSYMKAAKLDSMQYYCELMAHHGSSANLVQSASDPALAATGEGSAHPRSSFHTGAQSPYQPPHTPTPGSSRGHGSSSPPAAASQHASSHGPSTTQTSFTRSRKASTLVAMLRSVKDAGAVGASSHHLRPASNAQATSLLFNVVQRMQRRETEPANNTVTDGRALVTSCSEGHHPQRSSGDSAETRISAFTNVVPSDDGVFGSSSWDALLAACSPAAGQQTGLTDERLSFAQVGWLPVLNFHVCVVPGTVLVLEVACISVSPYTHGQQHNSMQVLQSSCSDAVC